MPRHPRIQLDGIPLHIVQRGQNREPCFFSEEDYASYLHRLGEALGENAMKWARVEFFTRKTTNSSIQALFRALSAYNARQH